MFWSVADDLYNADEVLANKQDYLERASNLKNGDSDLALVGAALGHVYVVFSSIDNIHSWEIRQRKSGQ